MRTFKKTLALVLALVMALSVAASAAAFSDYAAEQAYYSEVELLANLGVVLGTDGKLNPEGTLQRQEAAAFLYRLNTGKSSASVYAGPTKFDDVKATDWASGYINYCYEENILAGDGTGKYNPTGTLNFAELSVMLVLSAGYPRGTFSYPTGYLNKAIQMGIWEGVEIESWDTAVTRAEMCKALANTLFVPTVTYIELYSPVTGEFVGYDQELGQDPISKKVFKLDSENGKIHATSEKIPAQHKDDAKVITADNQVNIDGTAYAALGDFSEFVFAKADLDVTYQYYINAKNEKVIVSVELKKDANNDVLEIVTFAAKDLVKVDGSPVTYKIKIGGVEYTSTSTLTNANKDAYITAYLDKTNKKAVVLEETTYTYGYIKTLSTKVEFTTANLNINATAAKIDKIADYQLTNDAVKGDFVAVSRGNYYAWDASAKAGSEIEEIVVIEKLESAKNQAYTKFASNKHTIGGKAYSLYAGATPKMGDSLNIGLSKNGYVVAWEVYKSATSTVYMAVTGVGETPIANNKVSAMTITGLLPDGTTATYNIDLTSDADTDGTEADGSDDDIADNYESVIDYLENVKGDLAYGWKFADALDVANIAKADLFVKLTLNAEGKVTKIEMLNASTKEVDYDGSILAYDSAKYTVADDTIVYVLGDYSKDKAPKVLTGADLGKVLKSNNGTVNGNTVDGKVVTYFETKSNDANNAVKVLVLIYGTVIGDKAEDKFGMLQFVSETWDGKNTVYEFKVTFDGKYYESYFSTKEALKSNTAPTFGQITIKDGKIDAFTAKDATVAGKFSGQTGTTLTAGDPKTTYKLDEKNVQVITVTALKASPYTLKTLTGVATLDDITTDNYIRLYDADSDYDYDYVIVEARTAE